MKKSIMFGTMALVLIGLVASGAFASPLGDYGKRMAHGSEAIKDALKDGDYDAYLNALEETDRGPMDEETFDERSARFQEMEEKRAEVTAAIESGDYETWLSVIEGSPMKDRLTDVITEDNFDTFVELHEANTDGDYETSKNVTNDSFEVDELLEKNAELKKRPEENPVAPEIFKENPEMLQRPGGDPRLTDHPINDSEFRNRNVSNYPSFTKNT